MLTLLALAIRIISIRVVSPKVAKASKASVFLAGTKLLTNFFLLVSSVYFSPFTDTKMMKK
jgi:hypothetical protein